MARLLHSIDYSGAVTDEPRIDPATGHLYCTGYGSVEGICEYDGVRELVSKQSIRDQVALCARRPMTDGHPDVWVNANNWGELGVGDIGDAPEYEEIADPALGGYSRARARVQPSARRASTIADVQSGRKRGLSFGYTKEVDETPGTHEVFGAFDRTRTRVIAVNHLAFCEQPRVDGSVLTGFDVADSPSRGVQPMTSAERRKFIADNKPRLKAILDSLTPHLAADAADAVDLNGLAKVLAQGMSDKMGALLIRAAAEEGMEAPEPAMEAEPDPAKEKPMDPAAMDARIALALKPIADTNTVLRAELDALKTARAAQDAAAKAARDAAELDQARTLARARGLLIADADRPTCLAHLRRVLSLDASTSDDAVIAVASFADRLPSPTLHVIDSAPGTAFFSTEI